MNTVLLFSVFLFPLSASAETVTVDMPHSFFAAVTRRSGLLGFLGHEHGVSATQWTANIVEKSHDPSSVNVEIVVEAAALVVDTPEARRMSGLDAGGSGASDRAEIQEKMLGSAVLDAKRYPQIRFKSSRAKATQSGVIIEGSFSLHGTTRLVSIPIEIHPEKAGATRYTGGFSFRMSDYGIEPPSSGGVVNVKDEMEIRFELIGK